MTDARITWQDRGVYVAITVFIYALIYYVIDFGFISPSMSKVSANLATAYEAVRGGIELDKSVKNVALVLSVIPNAIRDHVIFAWGAMLLSLLVGSAKTRKRSWQAMALVVPSMIFAILGAFKETIVVAVFVLIGLAAMRSRGHIRNVICVGVLVVYAIFFRDYYYLTGFVLIVILLSSKVPAHIKFVLAFFVVAIMMVLPSEIYQTLQGNRDKAGMLRMMASGAGNRTAFVNLLPPDNLFAFVVNYIYAVFYLNLSFLFLGLGVKEVVQSAVICVYGVAIFQSLRSSDAAARLAGQVFLAHLMVLWMFEPDIGSYLRHSTSAFGLFLPLISDPSTSLKMAGVRGRVIASRSMMASTANG